jgi:AraC-like DNA-binding protein/mannose-6-phosphate isomerase-like protein (cupin superfamily)
MRPAWATEPQPRRPALAEMTAPQGSPAAITLRHYGSSRGSHAHAHFQVLLGLEGELELEIEGRGRRIMAGDGCLIAAGERHDFESASGSRCLVLDTCEPCWSHCAESPSHPEEALALARYLAHTLRQAGSLATTLGPSLLLEAWSCGAVQIRRSGRVIDWRALTAWVEQHLHEPVSVPQLAAQVCLSPTQFAARCRAETGFSVMQWLRGHRLIRAAALRAQGVKLEQVAIQCGYGSPSALSAALRQRRLRQ